MTAPPPPVDRPTPDEIDGRVIRNVLDYANRIDPGLVAASLSLHEPTRRKQQKIAAHWEAVGLRSALMMLGYDIAAAARGVSE